MRLLDPKKFCSINSGVWRSFWKLVKALKFRVTNLVRRSCECDGLLGYSLAQMRLHNWLNHFSLTMSRLISPFGILFVYTQQTFLSLTEFLVAIIGNAVFMQR